MFFYITWMVSPLPDPLGHHCRNCGSVLYIAKTREMCTEARKKQRPTQPPLLFPLRSCSHSRPELRKNIPLSEAPDVISSVLPLGAIILIPDTCTPSQLWGLLLGTLPSFLCSHTSPLQNRDKWCYLSPSVFWNKANGSEVLEENWGMPANFIAKALFALVCIGFYDSVFLRTSSDIQKT